MNKWTSMLGLLLIFAGIHVLLLKSPLGKSSPEDYELLISDQNQHSIDEIINSDLDWLKNTKPGLLTHKNKDIWIKTKIVNSNHGFWIFEIPFGWIHSLTLFTVDGEKTSKYESSDDYIAYQRVEFPTPANTEMTIYIKVPITGLSILTPILLPKLEYTRWKFIITMVIGVFLGAMVILLLSSIVMYFSSKEKVYLWYALFQLSTILFQTTLEGGLFISFPKLRTNYALSSTILWAFLALTNLAGIQFVFTLVSKIAIEKRLKNIVKAIFILYIISFSLVFLVPITYKSIPILFTNAAASIAILYGMIRFSKKGTADASFTVGWIGLGLSMLGGYAAMAGVLPNSWISLRLHAFGLLWEAVLLYFSLGKKIQNARLEKSVIRSVLTGKVSQTELNQIFEQPFEKINTSIQEITVMFIDIVGYSRLDNITNNIDIFDQLSSRLSEINRIIKKYNGNIDRSVGDGVICFFGYGSDDISSSAKKAFNAAREIQRVSVERSKDQTKMMLPVRIGINTDKVVVGNLGSSDRIDYTMIGPGVNIASRLEGACNPYCIMLSEKTQTHLNLDKVTADDMRLIHIKIKHSDSFVKAYEFNEFSRTPEILIKAEQKNYQQLNIDQKDPRFESNTEGSIRLISDVGELEVLDYSLNGLGVGSIVFFGSKTEFQVTVKLSDEKLNKALEVHLLSRITVKIRWSQADGEIYRAGLEYIGLNKGQRELLFDKFARASM